VKFVVMRSGGEPGEVAINAELVTHVRSASGPFTDVYFREHRVAVHGSFADTVKRLEYAASCGAPTAQQG
jgi:hypothetical protein